MLVAQIEDDNEDLEWRDECIRDGLEGSENSSEGEESINYEELRSSRTGSAWREGLKAKLFESGITSRSRAAV